jgi:hypothetical protein
MTNIGEAQNTGKMTMKHSDTHEDLELRRVNNVRYMWLCSQCNYSSIFK